MIFSIKYPFKDIYNLIIDILYDYYKIKLYDYYSPYQLSFCKAKCCLCEKIIFNECYSEIIHLNFGWNHCNKCKEIIKIWSSYYLENNNKFPLDYVSIDTNENFFRSKDNKIKKGYINIFTKYLNINNDNIYIALLYNNSENQMIMEWVLLENFYKKIFIKYPPYFSLKKFNYWDSKIQEIYNSKYLNFRF